MRIALVSTFFLAVSATTTALTRDFEGLFSFLDADSDGQVSREEFIFQVDNIGPEDFLGPEVHRNLRILPPTEKEVQRDIKNHIKNKYNGNTGKAFDDFDLDKNGSLNKDELTKALNKMGDYEPYTGNVADAILKKCDKPPCDGKLTKEELEAAAKGDPHFVTWYGSHFSFHGACDLVLVHNDAFNMAQGLDLHVRTQHMLNKAYSFISNAALRIGNDVLEVLASGDHFVNGRYGVDFPILFGDFTVIKTEKESCRGPEGHQKCAHSMQLDVSISERDHIFIKVASNMIHVDILGSADVFTGSVGLMGTYPAMHHGKIARDGETFIRDADEYAQEWQVLATEPKLFQGARLPQHPQKCIPAENPVERRLRQVDGIDEGRIAAEKVCAFVLGPEREFCVLDVMATGDYGMAATVYGGNE